MGTLEYKDGTIFVNTFALFKIFKGIFFSISYWINEFFFDLNKLIKNCYLVFLGIIKSR